MTISEFLLRYSMSVGEFAKLAGVCRQTIRRAKLGENITMKTALLIVKASKGKIPLHDLKIEDL